MVGRTDSVKAVAGRATGAGMMFSITVLVSSFLIFQIQPLISKFILPWFGGTPGVWTACMLFFQTMLFAGYAYAHYSIRRLSSGRQVLIHAALLLVALVALPIAPSASWKPVGAENPLPRIVAMLFLSVGLPYFLLAANSPLIQAWMRRSQPQATPYRLYALSNIGSLAGLLSYPFLVEPWLDTQSQAWLWSGTFVVFALCCLWCGIGAWRAPALPVRESTALASNAPETESRSKSGPNGMDKFLWFALSGCASVMLLASTNQVCLDVAVIPFLWVIPLSLYLLSLILVFEHEAWYPRRTYLMAMAILAAGVTTVLFRSTTLPILPQLIVHFSALFVCCMVCHGELARLKPDPQHLTSFYLSTAAGGAAGGIGVGLFVPMLFNRLVELQLGLLCTFACILLAVSRRCKTSASHAVNDSVENGSPNRRDATTDMDQLTGPNVARPLWGWVGLVVACLGLMKTYASEANGDEVAASRNFFGVLRVVRQNSHDPQRAEIQMVHGRTVHGRQFLSPERRQIATGYYGEQTGGGLALRCVNAGEAKANGGSLRPGRHCGIVGTGAGTLAVYGRPGDTFQFYEIDPNVLKLAEEHFTFLKDSQAKCEHVLGDARLMLEREESHQFDVLVLDAFSSDAIPIHLLTREAFAIYQRHLADEGVVAIHISNRFFDLSRVIARLADECGWQAALVDTEENQDRGQCPATWMLLSRSATFWNHPEVAAGVRPVKVSPSRADIPAWTDQFSNLISVLK